MDNIAVGKRIKEAREEKDMSLQEVAELTGLARSTIQRYEVGRIDKIKIPVIESIARALGVRPDWIIGKTNKKYPEIAPTPDILIYYNSLNTNGKSVATEQVRLLTLDEKYTRPDNIIQLKEHPELGSGNAAHADDYIHAPEHLKQEEENIMDDENF